MRTKEGFITLSRELAGDMGELERLGALNRRAVERIHAGATDQLDYGALAFTLHNLYSLLENYFLRVSKFFENNLPAEAWHRALLDRMALDIPGIRPALLEHEALRRAVMDLLKFRHKFRNLYAEEIDPQRIMGVQESASILLRTFPPAHQNFTAKLLAIAERL